LPFPTIHLIILSDILITIGVSVAFIKEDLVQIGELVKFLRKDQTQKWLAEQTKTTIPIISNIEKGKRGIPKKKLNDFAKALKVTPTSLTSRHVTATSLQEDLKEMGLAFRGLKELPIEARNELVATYRSLREKYLAGKSVINKSPSDLATEVLKKCGIKSAPVDLEVITSKHGIHLARESLVNINCDGLIICSPNREFAAIKIRDSLPQGRSRFTIAHELGHYFSAENLESEINCSPGKQKDKAGERFADEFAANLLMPRAWIKKAIPKKISGVKLIKEISEKFDVSYEAAAFNIIDVCEKDCAVYFSDNGVIQWSRLSKTLYSKVGPFPRGTQLATTTQVFKVLRSHDSRFGPEKTKPEYWFRQSLKGKFLESSTVTYAQKTLSLVWKQ